MTYTMVCIEGDRLEALLLCDGELVMNFMCGDDETPQLFGERVALWCFKELGGTLEQLPNG